MCVKKRKVRGSSASRIAYSGTQHVLLVLLGMTCEMGGKWPYIYIYIYICKEKEREREKKKRKRDRRTIR